MKYFRLVDGEWEECNKDDLVHLEKYKVLTRGGMVIISYWNHPDHVDPEP